MCDHMHPLSMHMPLSLNCVILSKIILKNSVKTIKFISKYPLRVGPMSNRLLLLL